MRFVIVALVSFGLFAACGEKSAERSGRVDKAAGLAGATPEIQQQAANSAPQVESTVPDRRPSLIQAELDKYADTEIAHSASGLSDGEKKMLSYLIKASKIIEELYMHQLNPKNVEWRDKVEKTGTPSEKMLFSRYHSPWCLESEDTDCSALAEKPERKLGLALLPDGMTDDEFKKLGMQINRKELLSPFTVVVRKDSGGFEAVPYAKTELFGQRMKKVAEELRSAAENASDESLKKFLKSRAAAFESESALPYDASDYDWIAIKGDWEVVVGPYETYESPRQSKALFEMLIGREDKNLTEELSRFKESLQEMEVALSVLVGPEIYQGRKLDPNISIRAIDVWLATGEGKRPAGATVALHLPNRGKAVENGLYKKLIMVNHSDAFEPIAKARAEQVLSEIELRYVDAHAVVVNVLFHELSHGFGAFGEMRVKDPNGKVVTVKEALGKYDSLFEELKADAVGLWLLKFETEKGWTTDRQRRQRYTAALMHSIGLVQYPLDQPHAQMAAIQLGWYLDSGALKWDVESQEIRLDFDKMPEAVESLAKEVAGIQLTGDFNRAEELVAKHLVQMPDGKWEAKSLLARLRNSTMEKFKNAGIKIPSLRYKITGIEGGE